MCYKEHGGGMVEADRAGLRGGAGKAKGIFGDTHYTEHTITAPVHRGDADTGALALLRSCVRRRRLPDHQLLGHNPAALHTPGPPPPGQRGGRESAAAVPVPRPGEDRRERTRRAHVHARDAAVGAAGADVGRAAAE